MADIVVDAHVHVFRPAVTTPRPVDDLAPAERDAPVEDLLGVMTASGVHAAVLVPLGPEDEYVAACVRESPGRFAGIAVADGAMQGRKPGVDPVADLVRRRADFGFHGVRTQWLGEPTNPVTSSPMFPVLEYMQQHGLLLWSYLTRDQMPLLQGVAETLPDLPIVLNHLGFCPHDMRVDAHRRPWFETAFDEDDLDRVTRLAAHRQVHLMFSGQYAMSRGQPPYTDLRDTVTRLADAYGPDRMLWASDYPWTRDVPGLAALQNIARELLPKLTESDLAKVHGLNAQRLFPHLGSHRSES